MKDQQIQQQITSFKDVLVVKNFLSMRQIRITEEMLDVGQWSTSSKNNKQNDDGTFYKWMPLLQEYSKNPKNADFNILDALDIRITNILLEHATKDPQNKQLYVKNCGIFSSSVSTAYYADNSYPIDSENRIIALGHPLQEGFHCEKNLDEIKTWKIRDGFDDLRYSCFIFLNDDFVGGGLVFPQIKVEIKPERNTLVVFPSTPDYIHGERPVSGVKNCFCSWYGSK
jgi:hypothetical protein